MLLAQLLTARSRASPLPHAQTFILADFCFYYVKSYAEGGPGLAAACILALLQHPWSRGHVAMHPAALSPHTAVFLPLAPSGTGVIHLPAGIV